MMSNVDGRRRCRRQREVEGAEHTIRRHLSATSS